MPRRWRVAAAVLLVAGAWAYRWSSRLPAVPVPFLRPRMEGVVGDVRISLRLPRKMKRCTGMDDFRIIAMPSPSPLPAAPVPTSFSRCEDARRMRTFDLDPTDAVPSDAEPHLRLGGAALHDVVIDRDLGGGSGGTEGSLDALLVLDDGTVMALHCHDQGSFPRPEWCLPFLHSLELD